MVTKLSYSLLLLASSVHAAVSVDGTLNQLFGSNGQTSIPLANARVSSVQIVTDKKSDANNASSFANKFVVAGSSGSSLALVSILPDGSAQTQFGNNGIAVDSRYTITTSPTGAGAGSFVSSVVFGDEIVVAATQSVDGHVLVIPYNASNGTPSTNSPVVEADLGAPATATGIAVLKNPNQKSFVVTANVANTPYLVFVENNSFRAVNTTFPFDALLFDVKVQNDGKIVATGLADDGTTQLLTARFLTTGLLDTTFGNGNGYQLTSAGANSRGSSLAIQGDGKIVATGRNGAGETVVVRYQEDGKIDSSFGSAGITTFDVTALEKVQVAIDNDGTLLVNGTVTTGTNSLFTIRYTQSGTADTSFGSVGIRATTVFNTASNLGSVAVPAPDPLNPESNPTIAQIAGATLAQGVYLFGATEDEDAVVGASFVTSSN